MKKKMSEIQTDLFSDSQAGNDKSCRLENFVSLPTITLWQPWASFIALGWKTIETRTHTKFLSLLHKTIGVHAGNKWDDNWKELAGKYLDSTQIRYTENEINSGFLRGALRGSILCTAKVCFFNRLSDHHSKEALINCAVSEGRYGLFLKDVKLIPPIPIPGKQGIWYYSTDSS